MTKENKYKILTLTILTFLCLGFATPKKETIFLGKVITDNKNTVWGLSIEFMVDTLVIGQDIIDEDGTFSISANAETAFDIYYSDIATKATYMQTIKPTDKDTILLTFKIPKDYKKHFGKTICPKCNKHDQTISIIYGWNSAKVFRNIDSKGDTTVTPYNNKIYYGNSCMTSAIDAKYFCKRDKIKF
ncbi:MAG: hypothetical protein V4538_07940 [Bacteroidota bacterium]